ncbi:hypothetical protein HOY80DRAFT_951640 [Tuber brumale]|nr:hypothetical protein HOY80DRAFT_951640 [Tuber brumale]
MLRVASMCTQALVCNIVSCVTAEVDMIWANDDLTTPFCRQSINQAITPLKIFFSRREESLRICSNLDFCLSTVPVLAYDTLISARHRQIRWAPRVLFLNKVS